MSTFRGHAKSLSDCYVYYQRLPEYYPQLAFYVSNAAHRIARQTKKYSQEVRFVEAQARAEFNKEKRLLKEQFGIDFNFDYYQNGDLRSSGLKDIIEAFNATLNLKEIYERNRQLIRGSEGQKGVYTWYPTYFMKAWESYWPQIKSAFEKRVLKGEEISAALSAALDQYMEKICINGIERMLSGPEVENSKVDPKLKKAYDSLLQQIGNVQTAGSIAQQIYQAYELDKVKKALIESVSNKPAKKIYAKDFRPIAKKMIEKDIHMRGGLSLEAIETAIFKQISQNGDTAIHTGSFEVKADNILAIGIDPTPIYEALKKSGKNRKENVQAFNELGQKLSGLKEGFIVYSSDKNYSLNSGFSGYGTGSLGATAQRFILDVNSKKDRDSVLTLLGAINQLGEGAMLENHKREFENLLAQDIAYMLFDDYSTIGEADASGRSIHIMNLNGIMVPISAILFLLQRAIETADDGDNIRRIAAVKIHAPKILFPTQEDQNIWQSVHPYQDAWDYQRSDTIKRTKITAAFLRNFRDLVSGLL